MISRVPELTKAGKGLLMRALAGETLTFTRMAIGSGALAEGQDPKDLIELIDEQLSIVPVDKDTSQEGLVAISGEFSSADIEESFTWRELGIYAMGSEDEVELLYAYANDGDDAGTLRVLDTDILTEQTLVLVVEIDDAENVDVIFNPHTQYAPASVVNGHLNNTNNPHGVTKEQVGLGNVPNKSPENMTVAFLDAQTDQNIASGEKLSTMFGRIKRILGTLLSHAGSENNPHSVTKTQVGLGNCVNAAPSDMEITFTEADVSQNMDGDKDLFTGSKLSVLMQRIGAAVHSMLDHISSTSNPHSVTASQVGLGNVENTAPSFNKINWDSQNTFALPSTGETMAVIMGKVTRDLTDLQTHLDTVNQPNPHGITLNKIAVIGTYTGNGNQGVTIATTYGGTAFTPSAVLVYDEFGRTWDATKGVCGGLALADRGIRVPNSLTADDATTWDNDYTALMIVTGGFKVNFYTGATAEDSIDTNESGMVYHYIAYK